MALSTGFFHDERCLWHSTQGLFSLILPVGEWVQPPASARLAESPESKRRAVSLLQVSCLTDKIDLRSAPKAEQIDLLRVHPNTYLESFSSLSEKGGGELGIFAPFGPGSFEIAKQSAGLAMHAVDSVLGGDYRNAYSMSRPPGHHCSSDTAMGFCLLNNIAIAIEAAKHKYSVERVAVLDWDVHHGNGTQSIFYDRSDVLTISLHQEGCFPPGYSGATDIGAGKGSGYNINVPLAPGSGHDTYQYAMEKVAMPAIARYKPDLIIVASGYAAGGVDPLGRMLLHSESYRELTQKVMDLAEILSDGKLVIVHEGGYAESHVPFCVQAVVENLSDETTEASDPSLELMIAQQPNERINQFHRQLIDEIAELHSL